MTCVECGNDLPPRCTVTCSKACRIRRQNNSEAGRRAKSKHAPVARLRQKGREVPRPKSCERCGDPARSDARFCSKACGGVHRRAEPKAKKSRPRKHWPKSRVFFPTCVVCQQVFATRFTVTTCSVVCREIKKRDDKHRLRETRRARKKAAYVADVYRRAIFERDGWTCQLCRLPLDIEKEVPHPLAPTIDHIVPLACGGTHEPRNAQAAHFLCNCKKSHIGTAADQLRLVGG